MENGMRPALDAISPFALCHLSFAIFFFRLCAPGSTPFGGKKFGSREPAFD